VNHTIGPFEVDFLWRRERVVVEVDGWQAHGHRYAFERDRARDAELVARGHVVLRFTWRQVADDRMRVVTRLAQALAVRDGNVSRAS
jgi:very-short-patch-repair endonuclease